jgi:hypothetical protein
MLYLSKKEKTYIYEPCEGVKITYRKLIGGLMSEAISKSMVDERTNEVDIKLYQENTLKACIVCWDGVGDEDTKEPAPVTLEYIRALPSEIFSKLFMLCQPDKAGADPLAISENMLNSSIKPEAAGDTVTSAGKAIKKTREKHRAK